MRWSEIEALSWADLDRLTWEQVEGTAAAVWPVLRELTPADRAELLEGLRDGSMPPGLVASGDPVYSRAQAAALALYMTYRPQTPADMAAYLAVLVALLSVLQTQFKDEPAPATPPPAQVIIVPLPVEIRPLPAAEP